MQLDRDDLARTMWEVDHPVDTTFEGGGVWVETAYDLADAALNWFATHRPATPDEPTKAVRWVVSCGCDAHGDHLACQANPCHQFRGCVHPIGEEITAATETEADARAGLPVPDRPQPTPDPLLDQLVTRACERMGGGRLPRWQTREVLIAALGTQST